MCFKKKSAVRKIFKTTDGFFNNKPHIKKPRLVVAVYQRKNDGALAVTKLHSYKGKIKNTDIKNLVLKPNNHSSLTKISTVENKVIWGINIDSKNKRPIYESDLTPTFDKVNLFEFAKIKNGIKGHKKTLHKWKKNLKNKTEPPIRLTRVDTY